MATSNNRWDTTLAEQLVTFIIQHVLCESQDGGDDAADAQSQHAGTDEQKHPAGVEDQQQALDHDDPHLTDGADHWGNFLDHQQAVMLW